MLSSPRSDTSALIVRLLKPGPPLIAYLLALLSILATLWIGLKALPLAPHEKDPLSAILIHQYFAGFFYCVIGILTSVLFTIIGFSLDIHSRLDDYGTVVRGLSDQLDRTVDCRYLGIGSETISQVMGRLENAKYVRNTFVFFGVPEHNLAASYYAEKQIEEAQDTIKTFLRRGGHWEDVVSQELSSSPTLNWLGFIEELRNSSIAGDNSAKAALDNYTLFRLKGTYPIVNFMLLRYANGDQEVIFGWGHHSEDSIGRVFLSRERRLVDMFDAFWRVLVKDSTVINPHITRPLSCPDITGLWFRVAYRLIDEDHPARLGVPAKEKLNPDQLHDVALVEIRSDNNRDISVMGRRYDPNSGCSLKGVFNTFAAEIKNSKLWFSTTNSRQIMNVSSAGWYRFIRPSPIGYKNDTVEEFFGEFLDFEPHSATKFSEMKAGKLVIFGQRVPASWLSAPSQPMSSGPGVAASQPTPSSLAVPKFLEHLPNSPREQIMLINEGLKYWQDKGKARWSFACGTSTGSTAPNVPPATSTSPPSSPLGQSNVTSPPSP